MRTRCLRFSLRVSFLFICLLLLISGCDGDNKKKSSVRRPSGASQKEAPAPAPELPKLTAAQLFPVIQEIGLAGAAPTEIVFEFAMPILSSSDAAALTDGNQRKAASAETRVKIVPEVQGKLEFSSPSTLVFSLENELQPSIAYRVTLEAVESRNGILSAPEDSSWSYSFTTPEFSLVKVFPRTLNVGNNSVTVDLTFTHAISVRELGSLLHWSIGGSSIAASYTLSQSGQAVQATLRSALVRDGAPLAMKLAPGLSMANNAGVKAPAIQKSFQLRKGQPFEIKVLERREVASGHYLEVICDDSSVEGDRQYYWDRIQYQSYELSPRCFVAQQQAELGFHFEPPVAYRVSATRSGFRIFGDFKRGSYRLKIDQGTKTVDGGELNTNYETEFSVPARSPQIHFASKGRYLPRKAWKKLAITHLNTDAIEFSVRHIPSQNLIFWLSEEGEAANERTSDVIYKQNIQLTGKSDEVTTSWLDVESLVPVAGQGIYELTLAYGGASDTVRLLRTDMNLVAKLGEAKVEDKRSMNLQLFAFDIHTGAPLEDVNFRLIRKSGFTLGRCASNKEGFCNVEALPDPLDPSPPFAIIASRSSDVSYIRFTDLKVDLSESTVHGDPYLSERPYTAAIYSDRGVYRPGETAHVIAILRDDKNAPPAIDMPVLVKLITPRDMVSKQFSKAANEAGVLDLDFVFDDYAMTGKYQIQLEAGKMSLGTYRFNVEEFVPERMKVEATPAKKAYNLVEQGEVAIQARYLFGGSAEGSAVELSCTLLPSQFKPTENSNFEYGVYRLGLETPPTVSLGTATGVIGADGKAQLSCPPIESSTSYEGPAELRADVAVFEGGGGRTTHERAVTAVHPETYYLGLDAGTESVKTGSTFKVSGIVVDWDGKPLPAAVQEVEITLQRLETEYGWYWDPSDGDSSFDQNLKPVVDGVFYVPVSAGRFSFDVTPTSPSIRYLVTAKAGKARTDLQLKGDEYDYYWSYGQGRRDFTPRPLRPSSINLELPEKVQVGKPAAVTFNAPFKGRALLTVETHKVIKNSWLDVVPGQISWNFTLDEFSPNVYVSALVVKDPHLESAQAFLPDRAFGVKSVRVEPLQFTREITLQAPKEVRSNSKLELTLNVGSSAAPTFVTIAAVDEGILSLTDFKSPDPLAQLFTAKALGVETYETIGWSMMLPAGGPTSPTGGDTDGGPKRVSPVKPVALWSGLLPVPADGIVKTSFDVPLYRGELRVMAVAIDGLRVGTATAQVTVRDPLIIQTTLPRFLLADDIVQIPIFVTNMTGKTQSVTVKLSAEALAFKGQEKFSGTEIAPLEFLGKPEGVLTIEQGASATAVFQARARLKVGAAKLRVSAKADSYESFDQLEVPFLPNGPRTRQMQSLVLSKGTTDVTSTLSGWVPTSESSTFWVTGNPYGDVFDHLKYLVHYPHGCIEQTTSSTRPLLYVSNLLYKVDPILVANSSIEKMVLHGVDRILSMQTPAGGFGYWPGDLQPSVWGTPNATHLLLDAQKLNYPVPADRIDQALSYMEKELTHSIERYEPASSYALDRSEAYLQYVLALAGRGRKARIERAIEALTSVETAEKPEILYLLKAALYLTGDHRFEKDLKALDLTDLRPGRRLGGSFYSDFRRRGLMFNIFQDLFGRDASGEPLANVIAGRLRSQRGYYFNTQELGWSITALGRWIDTGSRSFSPPSLLVNGKPRNPVDAAPAKKSSDLTWSLARASEYKTVQVQLDEPGDGKVFLIVSSEGIRENAQWETGGKGIKLSRRFVKADGSEFDGHFTLGDMIFTEITLANNTTEKLENLALVDRFPSGWEIENPRLGRDSNVSWIDRESLWPTDYLNLRDDRLEAFGTLAPGATVRMVYGLRAVTAGKFNVPPAEVEAMYNPDLWARSGHGVIEVEGPWSAFLF